MKELGLINEMLKRITALEIRLNELESVNSKKYYTLEEMHELTGYSKHTMYKKIKSLEINKHYFKPNGGKLIFDESAVDFLIKRVNNEERVHTSKQPIFIDDYFKNLDIK